MKESTPQGIELVIKVRFGSNTDEYARWIVEQLKQYYSGDSEARNNSFFGLPQWMSPCSQVLANIQCRHQKLSSENIYSEAINKALLLAQKENLSLECKDDLMCTAYFTNDNEILNTFHSIINDSTNIDEKGDIVGRFISILYNYPPSENIRKHTEAIINNISVPVGVWILQAVCTLTNFQPSETLFILEKYLPQLEKSKDFYTEEMNSKTESGFPTITEQLFQEMFDATPVDQKEKVLEIISQFGFGKNEQQIKSFT